jgi:hypothetical protein
MAATQGVTTAGRGWLADVMNGDIATPTYYFGCGTSAQVFAEGDTTLIAESACSRVAVTPTNGVATTLDFLAQWANTTGASIDVIEVGLFSASTGGVLIQRCVLEAAITVHAGWNFTCHTTVPLTRVV